MDIPDSVSRPQEDIKLVLLNESHFKDYFSIYGSPKLMKFIKKPLSQSNALRLFKRTLLETQSLRPDKLTYMIYSLQDDLIGLIGLSWDLADHSCASIGVMILPQWQRQRKGHHAKQIMIQTGFDSLQLKVIEAHCDVGNTVANLANQKLGFKRCRRYYDKTRQTDIQVWLISNGL